MSIRLSLFRTELAFFLIGLGFGEACRCGVGVGDGEGDVDGDGVGEGNGFKSEFVPAELLRFEKKAK